MYEKNYNIKDPAPFRAKDGSYYGDMEGVRMANEIFFNKMMKLKTNPDLDIPLTDEQLRQIINYPSYSSLVSVLEDGLCKDNEEEKGMKR